MTRLTRLFLAALAVAVAGCHQHADELAAAQASLDAQLVERKEIADNLNEYRRELERLEQRAHDAANDVKDDPEARAVLAATVVPPAVKPVTTFPSLPKETMWEGENGERRRLQIQETERRIAELDKIVGEVSNLVVRKKSLEAKLAALDTLRRERALDGGAR